MPLESQDGPVVSCVGFVQFLSNLLRDELFRRECGRENYYFLKVAIYYRFLKKVPSSAAVSQFCFEKRHSNFEIQLNEKFEMMKCIGKVNLESNQFNL